MPKKRLKKRVFHLPKNLIHKNSIRRLLTHTNSQLSNSTNSLNAYEFDSISCALYDELGSLINIAGGNYSTQLDLQFRKSPKNY